MLNHIWWKYGLSSRIVPDQLWPRQPRIIQPIYHLTILTDKLCTVCIAKAHLPKTRTLVGLQTTCWKRVFRDIVPREIRYCAEISFSSQTVTQMGGGLAQTPPIQISFIFFLDNLDYLKFIFFLVWFGLFDGQNEESFSNAMGSSVLITGKISTTPSQFRDPVILRVKTFIIGIYGKYESNVYMWAKRGGRTLAKLRRWSHVSFDFLHPYDVNYFYSMLYLIYLDRAIFRRANKSG